MKKNILFTFRKKSIKTDEMNWWMDKLRNEWIDELNDEWINLLLNYSLKT